MQLIDDVPEPEFVPFDTLSVLEMQDDEVCNTSALSSQFEFTSQHDNSLRTPKLSIATHTTKTGNTKNKAYASKHDEFDYNSYIREELQKLKAEDLDPQTRKRLIQKIRNRMSAQRSRNRSKMVMSQLQDENTYLRLHNTELIQKLQMLKEENMFLHGQLNNGQTDVANSEESTEGEGVISRQSRPETVALYKNVLVISAIVLAMTLAPNQAPQSVKLAGVVPLLTSDVSMPVKQLQDMDSICKGYCLRHNCSNDADDKRALNEVRLLSDITREVQLYTGPGGRDKLVPLMCVEAEKERSRHIFLFRESSLQVMRKENEILYAPELVIVKPEIGFVANS